MRWIVVLVSLMVVIMFPGCSEEVAVAPEPQSSHQEGPDLHATAQAIIAAYSWELEDAEELARELGEVGGEGAASVGEGLRCWSFEREIITGDIAHYSLEIQIGPGPYDVIGLHRVVRERRPYRPIRARDVVFMLHGDKVGFETVFVPGLYSSGTPEEYGIATFLAQRDIDVWGIDQPWYLVPELVPEGETDFTFMQDWGLQHQVDCLDIGVRLARLMRRLTGNGYDRLLLLGYSSGSFTGYAYLNQETQLPPGRRQIKGFIPVDSEMKTNWEELIEEDTAFAAYLQGLYDDGQYQDDVPFPLLAHLAQTDPGGDSPVFEGFTNWEAALGYAAFPLSESVTAHYLAGEWEEEMPTDFRFTPIERWLDFMAHGAHYEPLLFIIEYLSVECAIGDLPFDDHLGEITVPILTVGAGGGFTRSAYMGGIVASTDFSEHIVSLEDPEDAVIDFGHVDIFTADNAPELCWEAISEWVLDHGGH